MNSRVPTSAIAAASAVVLLSLGLSGCSSDSSSSAASSTSSGSGSSASAGSGDVVALAEAFAATLDDDQTTALNQDYTFANASNWSNFPNALLTGGSGGAASGSGSGSAPSGGSGAPTGAMPSGSGAPTGGGAGSTSSTGRIGLQTDGLTDDQWTALEALLAAATGSAADEGFDEIMQHLSADDYLADNGGGTDYGRGNYFIAFLGEPGTSGTWELQFGGHHLAVANTYVDGALAGATPSFRGIEPLTTVEENGVTVQPEQQEQAAFAALLAGLDDDQLATAQLSESFGDILLGPGNDWAFPTTAEGIAGSELTDDQKALLLAAIDTYVGDVDDADAATILAGYEADLDQTYVSFSGNSSISEAGDYIRIDGPGVWIEFSLQNGIVLDGAHPHAVWRDKVTDYAGLTS